RRGPGQNVIARQTRKCRHLDRVSVVQRASRCCADHSEHASDDEELLHHAILPRLVASSLAGLRYEQWKAMPADRARCSYSYACPHRLYELRAQTPRGASAWSHHARLAWLVLGVSACANLRHNLVEVVGRPQPAMEETP